MSEDTEKGKHTTTTARLLPLAGGGYVVDTPGMRQFQLWDVTAEEVAGYYRDVRPYVNLCRFPDCTHTHEDHCAVKDAVADGRLDERRYESYCHLFAGDLIGHKWRCVDDSSFQRERLFAGGNPQGFLGRNHRTVRPAIGNVVRLKWIPFDGWLIWPDGLGVETDRSEREFCHRDYLSPTTWTAVLLAKPAFVEVE